MADVINQNQNETSVRPWQYSIKIEANAKGYIQPSVHVYSDDMKRALQEAISALNCLVAELRDNGFKVATSIPEVDINSK